MGFLKQTHSPINFVEVTANKVYTAFKVNLQFFKIMDTLIYFKEFSGSCRLNYLLKDEYKVVNIHNHTCYYIPTDHILKVGRDLIPKINTVDYVCPAVVRCDQHHFKYWFGKFFDDLQYMVLEEKNSRK